MATEVGKNSVLPHAGGTTTDRIQGCGPWKKINIISFIAFLIIGCVGAAGLFPAATVGWSAIGLGLGLFVFNVARGNLTKRKVELLTEALFTTIILIIGTLAVTGILSGTQVGGGLISVVVAPKLIGFAYYQCIKRCKSDFSHKRFYPTLL